jgi:hypothetical protein
MRKTHPDARGRRGNGLHGDRAAPPSAGGAAAGCGAARKGGSGKVRTGFIAAALALLIAGGAAAQPGVGRPPIMKAEELRPGMKAKGYTVFSGTKVEEFDVTILGVSKNGGAAGVDMIIAEAHHPLLENHGIVAGMSGSPIFVDGRMIGAAAFGWPWSVRPVFGIQPIEGMIGVLESVTDEKPAPRPAPVSLVGWDSAREAFAASATRTATEAVAVPGAALAAMGLAEAAGSDTVAFEPLVSPLLVSSSSPDVARVLEQLLPPGRYRIASVGASPSAAFSEGDLAATEALHGEAIYVSYCEGDLFMGAIGTATLVEKDRIVAFGHPMSHRGDVDMPVARAEVFAIVPSVQRPFKLGRPIAPLGTLRQDRYPGIGITRASRPDLVPMTVTVNAPEAGGERTFQYRLWDARDVMAATMAGCIVSAIDSHVRAGAVFSIGMEATVTLADGRTVRRGQFFSGDTQPKLDAAFSVFDVVNLLKNNPAEEADIARIDVALAVGNADQLWALERVQVERSAYAPGDTVRGTATFSQWREAPVTRPFEIVIPANTPPGQYSVWLLDAGARDGWTATEHPEIRGPIRTLDDAIRRVSQPARRNRMAVALTRSSEDLVVDEQRLASLPKSVAAATRSTAQRTGSLRTSDGQILAETHIESQNQIVGSRRIGIEVRRRERGDLHRP